MRRIGFKEIFSNPGYRVERAVIIALFAGLGVTMLVHQITLQSVRDLLRSDRRVIRNYDLTIELEALRGNMYEIESSLRSYILASDEETEATIRENMDRALMRLENIRSLLDMQTREGEYFNKIQNFVKEKISFTETAMRLYDKEKTQLAIDLVNSRKGIQLRDSVVQTSIELKNLQRKIIRERLDFHQGFVQGTRRVEFVTTVVAFLIVSISILYLIRETSRKEELQRKLALAKEEAEKSALIKEQFMANMSHEIRTPLNAVLGFANLLQKTALTSQQQEYVHSMQYSGENLLHVVNDILDLSRIEEGKVNLEQMPFGPFALLHSIENLVRIKAVEKGLDFQVNISPEIPDRLVGAPNHLTQILVNLLSNAVKFTEQGKIHLNIYPAENQVTDKQIELNFVIRDTGIGIPESQLKSIFERFNQGSAETTRKYGGAGLGLAIVKNLVDIQNGDIRLESADGKGTTFFLKLPFAVTMDSVSNELPSQDFVDPVSFVNARVLVAEDNPMNRRITELLLSAWGIDTEMVENGVEALNVLKNWNFDLVFMDIQMPEMDGYETAQKIRQELKSEIPIIAMTAHVLSGEREKCLSYGMNDYLSKPLNERELYEKLIRFLFDKMVKTTDAPLQINMEYLGEISSGTPGYLKELAQIFLEQLPKELLALQQAIATDNQKEAARIAHSMKSTVAYMGLGDSLGKTLQELELQTSENGDTQTLKNLMQKIENQSIEAVNLIRAQFVTPA